MVTLTSADKIVPSVYGSSLLAFKFWMPVSNCESLVPKLGLPCFSEGVPFVSFWLPLMALLLSSMTEPRCMSAYVSCRCCSQ